MEKTWILYGTDKQHSFRSRDLLGVCTDKEQAIELAKQQGKKDGLELDDTQLFNLNNYNQTQGYEGIGEFHMEEVDVNTLL